MKYWFRLYKDEDNWELFLYDDEKGTVILHTMCLNGLVAKRIKGRLSWEMSCIEDVREYIQGMTAHRKYEELTESEAFFLLL